MKKLILSIFLLGIGLLGCSDKISLESQVFAQSGYWPGGMRAGYVTQTTGVLHLYADGTSGSDSNNCLTALTPCKTLQYTFNKLPSIIRHNTCIHLNGNFSNTSNLVTYLMIPLMADNKNLVIDGGGELTTVADNGGNPWSANISSISSIGNSGLAWSANAYRGYIVEILSGPAVGQHRTIQSNDATTITPHRDFTVDPGAGATFRISRYATTINATGGFYHIIIVSFSGYGRLTFQRLSHIGSGYLSTSGNNSGGASQVRLNHFLSNAYYAGYSLSASNESFFGTGDFYYDPTTFSSVSTATGSLVGATSLHSSGAVNISNCNSYAISALNSVSNVNIGASFGYIQGGSNIKYLKYTCALASPPSLAPYEISNSSNYATTKFGGGNTGIELDNSYIRMASGDISNCSSHAIISTHSELIFQGVITGTTNTGAGVYAHSGSVVHIKHGSPPTLTGTVGDFSVDGSTEATEWATLDAATPYSSTAEMTMAKEVP